MEKISILSVRGLCDNVPVLYVMYTVYYVHVVCWPIKLNTAVLYMYMVLCMFIIVIEVHLSYQSVLISIIPQLTSASQSRKNSMRRANTPNYSTKEDFLEPDSQPHALSQGTTSLPNSANLSSSPSNNIRSQSTPNKATRNGVHHGGHSTNVPTTHCMSSDNSHKMSCPSSKQGHRDIMVNVDSTTPISSRPPLNLSFAQDNTGNMHSTCPCRLNRDDHCCQCHQPLFPPSNFIHNANAAYPGPPIATQATCYPGIERDVTVGCDVVRCSVGVSTISSCNASTQTSVDAETQTDLSKVRVQHVSWQHSVQQCLYSVPLNYYWVS